MLKPLNAQYETMFMLNLCPWGDEGRNEVIDELDKLGIDGQEFYNRNFRLVEKYYHTFEKYKIDSPGSDLLSEMEDTVLIVCAYVFEHYLGWSADLDTVSDDDARDAVNKALISEFDDINKDFIDNLDTKLITDRAKWQLILLQQKAGRQLRMIASAISENILAFEKAYLKAENEISSLIKSFEQFLSQSHKAGDVHLPLPMEHITVIIPSLAQPLTIMEREDTWFYGLLTHKILGAKNAEITKDELIIGAKALSEKSKMEILLCLKEKSRYSLEIAELIGLTPATVSHHMNALLTSGFIKLEKRDGKYYYRLSEEGIRRFLDGARHLLLSDNKN